MKCLITVSDLCLGIQPGATAELEIEGVPELTEKECYLEISFTLASSTNWAKSGHELAFGQIPLIPAPTFSHLKCLGSPTTPQCKQITPQILEITSSKGVKWKFNIVHGTVSSWSHSGNELLASPGPVLDFYRAETDNDYPSDFGKSWTHIFLHQTKCHVRSVSWTQNSQNVTISVSTRIAPPVFEWSVDTIITYTFTSQYLSIKVVGTPKGQNVPPTFARIGLTFSLNDISSATWFGRGPGESYRDKKLSQKIGTYTLPTENLFTNYEFPQEGGNRTDTRWVELKGRKGGLKAYFGDLQEASFSASHYATKDVDESKHPYELYKKKKEQTLVRLDWAHHGIGTGSCGPATRPEYELRSGKFEYEVMLV
jgi:beta-galactosidase